MLTKSAPAAVIIVGLVLYFTLKALSDGAEWWYLVGAFVIAAVLITYDVLWRRKHEREGTKR